MYLSTSTLSLASCRILKESLLFSFPFSFLRFSSLPQPLSCVARKDKTIAPLPLPSHRHTEPEPVEHGNFFCREFEAEDPEILFCVFRYRAAVTAGACRYNAPSVGGVHQ
jgi:hypothetical protein